MMNPRVAQYGGIIEGIRVRQQNNILRPQIEMRALRIFLGIRRVLIDILTHMPDGGQLLDDSGDFEWLRHLKVLSISSFFEDGELKLVQEMKAHRNPVVGTIGAGLKELHMNLEGVSRSETTGLKSLESLCGDRGIHFTFDSWEGMVAVNGFVDSHFEPDVVLSYIIDIY